MYIQCHCHDKTKKLKVESGSNTPTVTRKRQSYATGCRAQITVQWESAEATSCTITRMQLQHTGHIDPRKCVEAGGTESLTTAQLTTVQREQIITQYVSLATNPDRKLAMDIAKRLAGHAVKSSAVDYMLALAQKEREQLEAEDLKSILARDVDIHLSALDISVSPTHSPEQNLVATLRRCAVVDPDFAYIVEYGSMVPSELKRYVCVGVHTLSVVGAQSNFSVYTHARWCIRSKKKTKTKMHTRKKETKQKEKPQLNFNKKKKTKIILINHQ